MDLKNITPLRAAAYRKIAILLVHTIRNINEVSIGNGWDEETVDSLAEKIEQGTTLSFYELLPVLRRPHDAEGVAEYDNV